MMEQIQQLIAEGRTEEALELLGKHSSDALLLQARFNAGKKQYNMGLIEFSEWQRTQAQINYAALEMAKSVKDGSSSSPGATGTTPTVTGTVTSGKKVFISYNHRDKDVADKVKDFLEKGGLDVTIDRERMEPGESIADFIKKNIKSNGFIVSLVSENSLQSGWVGMESTASLFAEWIADKHFIPVALDDNWSKNEFYIKALKHINAEVDQKEKESAEAKSLGGRTTHIESQIERLLDLKANLSQILEKLQNVLTLSILGNDFEPNMTSVLARIQRD